MKVSKPIREPFGTLPRWWILQWNKKSFPFNTFHSDMHWLGRWLETLSLEISTRSLLIAFSSCHLGNFGGSKNFLVSLKGLFPMFTPLWLNPFLLVWAPLLLSYTFFFFFVLTLFSFGSSLMPFWVPAQRCAIHISNTSFLCVPDDHNRNFSDMGNLFSDGCRNSISSISFSSSFCGGSGVFNAGSVRDNPSVALQALLPCLPLLSFFDEKLVWRRGLFFYSILSHWWFSSLFLLWIFVDQCFPLLDHPLFF